MCAFIYLFFAPTTTIPISFAHMALTLALLTDVQPEGHHGSAHVNEGIGGGKVGRMQPNQRWQGNQGKAGHEKRSTKRRLRTRAGKLGHHNLSKWREYADANGDFQCATVLGRVHERRATSLLAGWLAGGLVPSSSGIDATEERDDHEQLSESIN